MVQTLIRLPFTGASPVTAGVGSSHGHTGGLTYSYDFDMAFGQSVLAVAAGRVVAMRETILDGAASSYSGDPSLGTSNIGNFVTVEHQINGRVFYATYAHLRHGSVPLTLGATVDEGQVLGQVGHTGLRTGSHLHLQFGTSLISWSAGLVANAGATTANAGLFADLRFVGYEGYSTLTSGFSYTGAAATDLPANTGTEAVLHLNGQSTGTVSTIADKDWFRIEVQAGQTYTLSLDAGQGSTLDAFLRLHDATGRLIASDDDTGPGQNALLTFTALSTTHLFVSAGGYGASTGAYVLGFAPRSVERFGTTGADVMTGGSAADILWGRSGNDVISGQSGNDRLSGDAGADSLYGGFGNDRVDGGIGNDLVFGGAGADLFVFEQGDGRDTLRDFQNGSDRLVIDGPLHFGQLTFVATLAGTWVDYGNGEVFLTGVSRAQLDASDFIFV